MYYLRIIVKSNINLVNCLNVIKAFSDILTVQLLCLVLFVPSNVEYLRPAVECAAVDDLAYSLI